MALTRTLPDRDQTFDIIVIGGGITGAGIARDAALRGLSCLLLEKGDFASGTTSKSTRLIHGGLRYLANLEIDLVAEALRERAVLRRLAPYLIHPVPLLIPVYRGDRYGRAAVSAGVRIYDLLSHERDIPHYSTGNREKTLILEPRLKAEGLSGSAFIYDHQILMPERLVLENVIGAAEAGAVALNYMGVDRIEECGGSIAVRARDFFSNEVLNFRTKVAINAAGPWIDTVRHAADTDREKIIYPTKGIHLVLPRLSDRALFVTSRDNRMFFIIPFDRWSLIGTTDTKYDDDLDDVHANAEDVDYLINESKRVLPGLNITREAIMYTYAGIRPLAFDGKGGGKESKMSRKHRIVKEGKSGRIITIAGGKLTTYRNMARDAVNAACEKLGLKKECTTDVVEFPGALRTDYDHYLKEAAPEMAARYNVPEETVRHLIGLYGSRSDRVLSLLDEEPSFGARISTESGDIYAQVTYSIREEGAKTLSDMVLRRMHLGITSGRGAGQAEKIAELASYELGWSKEEKQVEIDRFRTALEKDQAWKREEPGTGR